MRPARVLALIGLAALLLVPGTGWASHVKIVKQHRR